MKSLIFALLLTTSQAFAGELLMDCHFGKETKTFSLAALDKGDGACHVGNFDKREGPVLVRYQIELCGMEATGVVMTKVGQMTRWDVSEPFSTRRECQLRRKIESAPPRCIPARSHC